MRGLLCFFGLHHWLTRQSYPRISYCKHCRRALDERADGYVPATDEDSV